MNEPLDQRLQLVISKGQVQAVDDWRRQQPDLPSRSEAIRRLIEAGLSGQVAPKRERGTSSKPGGSNTPKRQTVAPDQAAKTPVEPRPRQPRAKPAAMSKEAQIRALREQGTG